MDAVLFWNNIALDAVAQDHTGMPAGVNQRGPTRTSRALAIIHLAMYDAFNSIAIVFTPYLPDLPVPSEGASKEAAIGQAAYITLINLYPGQSSRFLQASETFFKGLSGTPDEIKNGREQGQVVAKAILSNRADDQPIDAQPYIPNNQPGQHRVDPLNPDQGFLTPNWGQVRPFAIKNFLADPPPALHSARYTQDYNDVAEKGISTGGTRTPEETAIGLFWAYDGAQQIGTPPRLYNQIVREIAVTHKNHLEQNVRLFALINLAMGDAGIQCWYSKYFYNVWRPVLGVREASPNSGPTGKGDGNPETKGDPFWLPLGAPRTNQPGAKSFTPNFPAYPSGHATFGAATFDMVRLFYGKDEIPFSFVSDELNGKNVDMDGSIRTRLVRHYKKLSDAIDENGRSRVYLGVHWQFDADGGIDAGKKIAQEIFQGFLRPDNS